MGRWEFIAPSPNTSCNQSCLFQSSPYNRKKAQVFKGARMRKQGPRVGNGGDCGKMESPRLYKSSSCCSAHTDAVTGEKVDLLSPDLSFSKRIQKWRFWITMYCLDKWHVLRELALSVQLIVILPHRQNGENGANQGPLHEVSSWEEALSKLLSLWNPRRSVVWFFSCRREPPSAGLLDADSPRCGIYFEMLIAGESDIDVAD